MANIGIEANHHLGDHLEKGETYAGETTILR